MKASVDREHVENTYCPALQKEDMQLRAAIDLTRQGSVVRPEGRVQDTATSENVTQSQPSVELLSMAKVCDSVETILGYSDTQRRHTSSALALSISFRTDEQRAMLQQILNRNYSDEKELRRAYGILINIVPLRLLAERPAPAEEKKYYADIGTDGLCLIRCMLKQRAHLQGRTVPANLHVTNPEQRRLLQQELEHIESTSSLKNRRVITPFLNKAKAMIKNPAHSRILGEDYPPPEVFFAWDDGVLPRSLYTEADQTWNVLTYATKAPTPTDSNYASFRFQQLVTTLRSCHNSTILRGNHYYIVPNSQPEEEIYKLKTARTHLVSQLCMVHHLLVEAHLGDRGQLGLPPAHTDRAASMVHELEPSAPGSSRNETGEAIQDGHDSRAPQSVYDAAGQTLMAVMNAVVDDQRYVSPHSDPFHDRRQRLCDIASALKLVLRSVITKTIQTEIMLGSAEVNEAVSITEAQVGIEEYITQKCTQLLPELRPEKFPEDRWHLVADALKPHIKERWSRYTDSRLDELIAAINKIEISEEDTGRVMELPLIRAHCLANLDIFGHPDEFNAPPVKGVKFAIRLRDTNCDPARCRMRRYNHLEKGSLECRLELMLAKKHIVPSNSEWSSPPRMVPNEVNIQQWIKEFSTQSALKLRDPQYRKRVSTLYRLTGDFRQVNDLTILEPYPLPRVDDLLEKSLGAVRFSCGDIEDAFFTVEIEEESCKYTAFQTPFGCYEYKRMAQGLTNAAAAWAKIIADGLKI